MSRSQYCREHIDKVAEMCGLERSTVSDVKQAAKFCDEHSDLSECSTRAIMALIRVKDEEVRERAISLAENQLNQTTPTGGRKQKSLTEKEVRAIIKKADLELRKDLMQDTPAPEKEKPAPTVKPIRCMYLSKSETGCYAPPGYSDRCTEAFKRERNCPLPMVETPPPKTLSDVMNEGAAPEDQERELQSSGLPVNTARSIMPQVTGDAKYFKVVAGRFAQSAMRQFVYHKLADDEDGAAQRAFDLGVDRLLDEIEAKCQAEPEDVDEDEVDE